MSHKYQPKDEPEDSNKPKDEDEDDRVKRIKKTLDSYSISCEVETAL